MTRDSGFDGWTSLHTLPLSAPTFLNEMARFCEQVSQGCNGDTSVTVYLPEADITCGSVSVLGRTKDARDLHVRRTLARQLGDQPDNIVAHCGQINAEKIAPVCFALKETLYTAERFIKDFGFRVRNFSTFSEHGLNEEPCLMLPHQAERLQRINAVPKVSYAFHGAIAAMVVAGVFIGANIPKPNELMMSNILDAGHVLGQPVQVALHIAGFENENAIGSLGTFDAVTTIVRNRQGLTPQGISVANMPNVVKAGKSNITITKLGADRIIPSAQAATRLDAIASHQGGFAVYVGLQANLTQLTAQNEESVSAGQIVYIQKPAAKIYRVARAIESSFFDMPSPDQFMLTELEMASFSRP
jgi:hypothetical protein